MATICLTRDYPPVQELEGGEVKAEFYRVSECESSTSPTTDTSTSLQRRLLQNGLLQRYRDQKLVENPCKFDFFFHVKPSDFRFVTWFMSIFKFGLSRPPLKVSQTKPKAELF